MRRGRPLGLTLALLACTVLYGLYPLAEAALYATASLRSGSALAPRVVISLIVSVAFLLLLIPAWRGRPPQIRLILTAAVLSLAALNVVLAIYDLVQASSSLTFDAASQIGQTVDRCALPVYLLVTLYIVWYLNRYPSRQYYGGAE